MKVTSPLRTYPAAPLFNKPWALAGYGGAVLMGNLVRLTDRKAKGPPSREGGPCARR
jgi:hypothetical protein